VESGRRQHWKLIHAVFEGEEEPPEE